MSYQNSLQPLSNYRIPRCYSFLTNVQTCQLVGFRDASPKAYCAIIFLRVVNNNDNVTSSSVCAKTCVAPIQALTIPRLELQAALILSQLLNRIAQNLNIDQNNIFAFSDSQIVLCWLNYPIEQLKQFVRNRVAKIVQLIPKERWTYIETSSNPADLATRGISVKCILENKLWPNGPHWLLNDFYSHVNIKFKYRSNLPETCKLKTSFNIIKVECLSSILDKVSSLIAYIFRFVNNIKLKQGLNSSLTVDERNAAIDYLIWITQLEFFNKEYLCLTNKTPLNKRSKLFALNVFLDKNNLIRVGGRLTASNFSYDTKFPIVMSFKARFIELYIEHVHKLYFHASKSFLLSFVRRKFWVIGGLSALVKKICFQCVRCTRINANFVQQFMGDLPPERTAVARPFTTTGVDLSGAYRLKCTNHRSTKYTKTYITFFVCFVTRAIYVELIADLITESFLSALERFISRRGLPQIIYSDNATNFVGTNNVLEQSKLTNFAVRHSIIWKFIPPHSPHQGELWESAVKSGKVYLLKAVGIHVLNYDEFNTILSKVEAILNSRPIAYQTKNSFVEPLTPGHF